MLPYWRRNDEKGNPICIGRVASDETGFGKRGGVPTIGNRGQIGANAIVVGRIQVGNDVLIALGAFVNFDVPDNSIVIGNPGQIITKKQSPTTKYIVYSVQDFR